MGGNQASGNSRQRRWAATRTSPSHRWPGPPPRPTAYLADRLLVVQDHRAGRAHALVTKAAGRLGLEVRPDQRAERLRGQLGKDPAALVVASITLVPAASTIPVAAPDAWSVLVTARALAADADAEDVEALGAVCLDHLLAGVGPDVAGLPHTEGHGTEGLPHTEGHGTGGYTRPGTGGRQPVSWLGPAPPRGDPPPSGRRRPVVAVLDTGCAPHPWLDDAVDRDVRLGAQPAGDVDPATDPEVGGDLTAVAAAAGASRRTGPGLPAPPGRELVGAHASSPLV